MSRRTFLRSFGLLGVAVAGASAAMANTTPVVIPTPEPTKKDFAHLAPEGDATGILTLAADNRARQEKEAQSNMGGMYIIPSFNPTNQVSMTVGKDDRLWLKIGDKWKRVALDA